MDLGRALDVTGKFAEEVAARGIVDRLAALSQALQQSVQSPNPSHDDKFSILLREFLTLLEGCPSNEWPATQLRALEQLHLAEHTGKGLRAVLDGLLISNSMTRTIGFQRLAELVERERNAFNMANQILASFRTLGVQPKLPKPEQCEVSVFIPTAEAQDTLEILDGDLEGFNRLLKVLSEISGEGAASPRVTALENGSWIISLDQGLQAAIHLAALVSAIIGIIRGVATLRKKTKAIADEPDTAREILTSLEQQAARRREEGLERLAKEMAQNAQVDQGRRNQLEAEMEINVRFLARKLDRGVRIEISPPDALPASAQQNKSAEDIAQLQASLAQLKQQALDIAKAVDLKEPALMLPEPDKTPEKAEPESLKR